MSTYWGTHVNGRVTRDHGDVVRRLIDVGKLDEAAGMVAGLAEGGPLPAWMLWHWSEIARLSGDWDAAMERAQWALAEDPGNAGLAVQMLRIATDSGYQSYMDIAWPLVTDLLLDGPPEELEAAHPGVRRLIADTAYLLRSPFPDARLHTNAWVLDAVTQWISSGDVNAAHVLWEHTANGHRDRDSEWFQARAKLREADYDFQGCISDLTTAWVLAGCPEALSEQVLERTRWLLGDRAYVDAFQLVTSSASQDPLSPDVFRLEAHRRSAELIRRPSGTARRYRVSGSPDPLSADFKGIATFNALPLMDVNDSSLASLMETHFPCGLSPDGRSVVFAENRIRDAVRRAPFAREIVRTMASEVVDVPTSKIALIDPGEPISQTVVVSCGRVGSTLLVQLLRHAGVDVLSETDLHRQIPELTFYGRLATGEGLRLARLGARGLAHPNSTRVVNKLMGSASPWPESLMGASDDAVVLWRSIEEILASYRRMNGRPDAVISRIVSTLKAHRSLRDSGLLREVLWYEDLLGPDFSKLEDTFSNVLSGGRVTESLSDSQAGTNISRSELASRIPQYSMADYRDAWTASQGPVLARSLDLTGLESAPRRASATAATRRSRVFVAPMQQWGYVDHFYHFLLGYLLPIVHHFSESDRSPQIAVADCGPLSRHFASLAGWDIEIAPLSGDMGAPYPRVEAIPGWDHFRAYDAMKIRQVATYLKQLWKLEPDTDGLGAVTVVDRQSADNYYMTDSLARGAGAQRRSVPNLDEVVLGLRQLGMDDVHMVGLEALSLPQQAWIFANSRIIIAQHGAALANLAWCRPGTLVVEIVDVRYRPDAFRSLAQVLDLAYIRVPQAHAHALVDVESVLSAVRMWMEASQMSASRPRPDEF